MSSSSNKKKSSAKAKVEPDRPQQGTNGANTLQILLQTRAASLQQCQLDRLYMTPRDMKTLGAKAGSIVAISTPTSSSTLLCLAWPSKTAAPGCAVLNRMWWPNFPSEGKRLALVDSNATRFKLLGCQEAHFVIVGLDDQEAAELALSKHFAEYIRTMLMGVRLVAGLLVGVSWKNKSIVISVQRFITTDPLSAGDESQICCAINPDSVLRLFASSSSSSSSPSVDDSHTDTEAMATSRNSFQSSTTTSGLSVDRLNGFGGYSEQVKECISILKHGLGQLDLHRQPSPTQIQKQSNSSSITEEPSVEMSSPTSSPNQNRYDTESDSINKGNSNNSTSEMPSFLRDIFRPPKGLLIHGPPGVGKSHLMRTLARAAGCPTVEITHSLLLSRYAGEAESKLRKAFTEARRLAPCCILMDDVDLLCLDRSIASTSQFNADQQQQLVSCILSLIDGVLVDPRDGDQPTTAATAGTRAVGVGGSSGSGSSSVFIIATSSRPNRIDQAMRRPGRLDKEIELTVPTSVDKEEILQIILQNVGIDIHPDISPSPLSSASQSSAISDVNSVPQLSLALPAEVTAVTTPGPGITGTTVKELAKKAHGMTAADLLLVVKEAHLICLERHLAKHEGKETTEASLIAAMDSLSLQSNTTAATPAVPESFVAIPAVLESTPFTVSKSLLVPTREDLLKALGRVPPSALREVVVEVPTVYWGDIGGMDGVKQSLREVVEWPQQFPHLFESLGISPPKGVLLFGPPGCSKTLMAKALATESGMNFLAVRGPELLSKWLGESEKAVQALFRRARAAAPSIIFFDEIDALAGKRGGSSGVNDRVLSQLLTELDGAQGLKQVIVVAATNRPDMLDPALTRPGRIDRKIYVPPPDEKSREQILSIELRKMPTTFKLPTPTAAAAAKSSTGNGHSSSNDSQETAQLPEDDLVFFEELVRSTAGFSGAEVVASVQEAAMLAVDRGDDAVDRYHIREAIAAIKPQITKDMLRFYEALAAQY